MVASYRKRLNFWLDAEKEDEKELLDVITKLKKAYKYSWAIRSGLQLIQELSHGKVDLLLELFPFVKDAIASRYNLALAGQVQDQSSLLFMEQFQREQFQRLESLLNARPPFVSVAGDAKALDVQDLEAPQFEEFDDDEDMNLVLDDSEYVNVSSTNSNLDAADRLIDSLKSMSSVSRRFDD